jgi:NAD(P)-dependent dehydrogenase (short-subunit alcohol dehydrogenase family)
MREVACIVTGAAAGNGLAMARAFRAAGAGVVAIDLKAIPDDAGDVRLNGDAAEPALMEQAFETALGLGRARLCLINNAGVTPRTFPTTDADWARTLEINLTAPFRWTRHYADLAQAGRICAGSVLFIASLAAFTGFPRNPAYQASKAGVAGLMRAFAYDLGRLGVTVNALSPGYIRTGMTAASHADPVRHAARRRHTLLDRWGEPEDVAAAALFLCGPGAAYITGVNLPVDGGWLAKGLIEADDD